MTLELSVLAIGVLVLVCIGLFSLAWRALDIQPDVPIDEDERDDRAS